MNRQQLHKFFEGNSSPEEKKAIREWLDSSGNNRTKLMKEREFFDALILSSDKKVNKNEYPAFKRNLAPTFLIETLKIAAIITIVFTTGFYFHQQTLKSIKSATSTIIAPSGQRTNILLPDGTNVWLNARSELTYPASFAGSTREIELKGEAYFEVRHNKKQPFIVHTDKYDIKVLGTAFNVEAYDDSADFSTALMEGSVEITNRENHHQTVKLFPNQKVTAINGQLITQQIEDFDIYRWRDGLICFKETSFKELMKRFEKCYGIDIIIENRSVQDKEFSGKFRLSDGIDNALRVLQKEGRYTFERNSDDSVLYIR